jgi:uncharacterized protein (DUF305 family)
MSRFTTIFILPIVIVYAACDRRPVQEDIPARNTMVHSNTAHREMTSSPGAADAPYELQFIDTMIAHHEGAIDAAQLVATRAEHDELKQLAASIIRDQQKEVAQMREWRARWFGDRPAAINMDLKGMREGMKQMDLLKLDGLKLRDFDLEFIAQMIPHHLGAVTMAQELLAQDTNSELRTLAENIVRSQSVEIDEMRERQRNWQR